MPTYRLTVAYDGSGFAGSQEQPDRRTVVGVVRDALLPITGERPAVTVAGRTDAGAHAHGQVIGVTLQRAWDATALRRALDSVLPEDVSIVAASIVSEHFHARRDAADRTYRYAIVTRDGGSPVTRRHAWTVRGPLDIAAMREAAAQLVGTHDFAAFGAAPKEGASTVRTVFACDVEQCTIRAAGSDTVIETLAITVRADAFLRGMMRAFAGALVRTGQGRADVAWLRGLVHSAAPERAHLTLAPAAGLHQWAVHYPDAALQGVAA